MWFHHVSFVVMTCIFLLSAFLFFLASLFSFVLFTFFLVFLPPSSYFSTFLYFPRLLLTVCCPVCRPVMSRRRQCSAWLLARTLRRPSPARCRAGTWSRRASRERWSSLCRCATCCSACSPGLMRRPGPLPGACLLPSGQTSPGSACLFPGSRTLGVARAAGG